MSCVFSCSVGIVLLGVQGVRCVGNGSQYVWCVFGIRACVDCFVCFLVIFGWVDLSGGVFCVVNGCEADFFGWIVGDVLGGVSLVWCGVWDGHFPLGSEGLVCTSAIRMHEGFCALPLCVSMCLCVLGGSGCLCEGGCCVYGYECRVLWIWYLGWYWLI